MAMTRDEFKRRWESDDNGGGITFNDVADCAVAWGISRIPRIEPIHRIRYAVLKAAGTSDAEEYNPAMMED